MKKTGSWSEFRHFNYSKGIWGVFSHADSFHFIRGLKNEKNPMNTGSEKNKRARQCH